MAVSGDRRLIERKYLVFYLRVFDGRSSKILGYLADISERGLKLIGDEPLVVNQQYRLRMRLPALARESGETTFTATCCWCRRDSNPEFYVAGFRMGGLQPATRQLFASLISEFGFAGDGEG